MNKTRYSATLPVQIVVCLISLAHVGCQRRPTLVDTLGTLIDDSFFSYWNDSRQLAPIIVVASVEENRVVAKHVEAARYQGLYLDLHAVRCKRENSLKGSLTESRLTFFYFADGKYSDSKPNPRYKRLFQAKPGSRYLFFLTRDRDVLRSIGDVGEYSLLVATGTHPGNPTKNEDIEDPTKNEDIGKRMSEILLTPGSGADFELMAGSLHAYRLAADIWSSRIFTVELLRRLTALPEPVGSAACAELVEYYYGQEDCLRALSENENKSTQLRTMAADELKRQIAIRQRVSESLRDPASTAYLDSAGDSRRRVREELQTLLFSSDATLRERVCTALRRYYPNDAEPKCFAAKKH